MDKLIIIGARTGIGRALFERVKDKYQVITIGREPFHESVQHFQADVISDELPVVDGPVRGLVYCPGSINLKPFKQLKDEDFVHDLNVNLVGAARVIRHFESNLRDHGGSRIVLFSTVAASTGMAFHASVAAAKAAVEGLGRSLAAEFAPHIRVNMVAPSLTRTPMAERLLRNEKQEQASADRHPLKRIGEPNDIAAAAEFLLSDDASWMTGQTISVDGGIGRLR